MTSPRLPLALLIAASAFALAGCSPEAAVPSAPPAAEAEPLFASDEEALAAAEAAYAEYLAVVNTVLQEGGTDPERIRPLVSNEVWTDDLQGAERWQQEGLISIGETRLEKSVLQQVISTESSTEVVTYNCLSNTGVDVLNEAGESVVSADRPTAYVIESVVSFTAPEDWTLEEYSEVEEVESCAAWQS
ncbi:hypothetical protein [Microcella alkalica]|uniref:Lipoprotein n=1 Tax=Microcella alkalica TaxID=355930 RepID=A0A839EC01_9MICO|nr:hypothetical protein [Microcella alkalica]MBA8846855.1 hypothetical protein [Microcella alkalica]